MERYDLSVHRGETFRQELIFRNSDGTARDLTGWQGFSQVRPDPESEELICSMDVSIDGSRGKVTMMISPGITKTIPEGCYVYDLAMKSEEGIISYYIGGKFSVFPSVTEISGE